MIAERLNDKRRMKKIPARLLFRYTRGMPRVWKIFVTVVFIGALGTLGTLDALLLPSDVGAVMALQPHSNGNDASSGVDIHTGPDVTGILQSQHLTPTSDGTGNGSLLSRIITDPATVQTYVLLKDNDRVALFSWTQSANVKEYFNAMRTALLKSFSPGVRDLHDDRVADPGKPVRDVLSFLDPQISDEKIILMRVQDRLYEFHVAPGKEMDVQGLMEALSM